MKASNYNLYFKAQDGGDYDWIVANTSTGAIVCADDELKCFIECPQSSGRDHLSRVDASLLADIIAGSFILDDDMDELGRLGIRFASAKYSERAMHLTVIPATGCNLRCTYCYETHRGRVMNEDVVGKIAAFVRAHSECLEYLSVTWFGGEPLLAKRAIKSLSKELIDIAREGKFTYSANIITNGTLLDAETVDMLVEAGVAAVQITLDGPADVHDSRRFYAKRHAPSFDDVLTGIRNCRGKLPVGIRINVDKSNIGRYPELVDRLFAEGLLGPGSGNSVALGLVKHWTNIVGTANDDLIGGREFERYLSEQKGYVANKSRALTANAASETPDDEKTGAAGQFNPKFPCAAVDRLNYVVMSNGDLKKCWIHATESETEVGDVIRGIDLDRAVAVKWQAYDPTRDSECAGCSYLPVCAGGCPYEMMERPQSKPEHCAFIKRFTERNVRTAAQPSYAAPAFNAA
jgi:uncharacterized protein